jgi:hypothetical protein
MTDHNYTEMARFLRNQCPENAIKGLLQKVTGKM